MAVPTAKGHITAEFDITPWTCGSLTATSPAPRSLPGCLGLDGLVQPDRLLTWLAPAGRRGYALASANETDVMVRPDRKLLTYKIDFTKAIPRTVACTMGRCRWHRSKRRRSDLSGQNMKAR